MFIVKNNVGHWYKDIYIKYCKICQYDKNMNLLKIWNSQGEVSVSLGIDQGSISKAIKNNYMRYVYYWKKIKE